jgi:2-iminobutanoate/2-iminopropanoate deaminase
MAFTSG